MQKLRIVIADDHPVVRAGLEGMLGTQSDFEVVGTAGDGEELLCLVARLKPNIALVDLRMPGLGGVRTLERLRAEHPATRALVLTTYDADADMVPALRAGAWGYLLKDTEPAEIYRAIREVAAGRKALSAKVEKRMADLRNSSRDRLTSRELQVLQGMARGETNSRIAQRLFVSEATVKSHVIHVFRKLGVDDRTRAVMVAVREGLLEIDVEESSSGSD